MSNLFDLSSDVAIVIGGTGILGGALADGLAASGAKVAVVGRNAKRGEARAKAIQEAGGTAAFFAVDAVDRGQMADIHRKIEKAFGPPTILVNAAGGNDSRVTVTHDLPFTTSPSPTGKPASISTSSAARSSRARNSAPAW